MALRTGHGNGAGVPRVEVLPPDELPDGLPAHADRASRAAAEEHGRFAAGNRRSVLGGRSRAGKARLAERLGLAPLAADAAIAPYMRSARAWRRAQCAELARTVGGGVCGPGPSSIVASAALALAWSRYLADQAAGTGNEESVMRAARLGETSRQHLLAAHELCAREAKARPANAAKTIAALAAEDEAEERAMLAKRKRERDALVAAGEDPGDLEESEEPA